MKINKTLGDELYWLFGPNGSNQIVGRDQVRRLATLRELERHGLVSIEEMKGYAKVGFFDVRRLCRGLEHNTH